MTDAAPAFSPSDRARRVATQLMENVYELTGGSMSPTLERGWKVLVEPLDRRMTQGDVVLLEAENGCVIHRYLGTVTWGLPPREYFVEAGDSSARPGVVPPCHVKGRVTRVIRPYGQRLLRLDELPTEIQQRLLGFLDRWRTYARLRRLADVVPALPWLLGGALRRAARGSRRNA